MESAEARRTLEVADFFSCRKLQSYKKITDKAIKEGSLPASAAITGKVDVSQLSQLLPPPTGAPPASFLGGVQPLTDANRFCFDANNGAGSVAVQSNAPGSVAPGQALCF